MSRDVLINATAEAALLGAMMLENRLIVELADHVRPTDFGDALHGRIYSAMLKFHAKGKPVSAALLRPVFQNDSDSQYGEYLDQLVEAPAVVTAASSIADQVADLAARRDVRQAMKGALESLEADFERPVEEITAAVENAGWAAAKRGETIPFLSAGDLANLVTQRSERILNQGGKAGLENALVRDWDEATGALEPATYTILAGRPGMGKSALASSVALGYALKGHHGLYFNHEMMAEQFGLRTTADLGLHMGAGLTHARLKGGTLRPEERDLVDQIAQQAALLPIRYISPRSVDVRRVWSWAAQHKAMLEATDRRLDFVIVDYLGLLGATGPDGKPIFKDYERISAVSKTLKRMAEELDVALIALAQLSRDLEQRANKRPVLSDLRGSGELEQDADLVAFVYRDEVYLEREKPQPGEPRKGGNSYEEWENEFHSSRGKMEIICAKNRHGKTQTRIARFVGDYTACRSGDFNEFEAAPAQDGLGF